MPNPKFTNIANFINDSNSYINKIHIYARRLKLHSLEKKYQKSFAHINK